MFFLGSHIDTVLLHKSRLTEIKKLKSDNRVDSMCEILLKYPISYK